MPSRLVVEAAAADERDETAGDRALDVLLAVQGAHHLEALTAPPADGNDEPSLGRELCEQRGWGAGAAAATAIASYGARSGTPSVPSPTRTSTAP